MSETTTTRRDYRGYGTWIPGLVLIGIGVVFLAREYFAIDIRNWWAFFILIPAFFSLERAYSFYRSGEMTPAIGALIGGLAFIALAIVFLLDLDIGRLWPIFLIIAGIAALLGRRSWSAT